jgi:hypothetical protein
MVRPHNCLFALSIASLAAASSTVACKNEPRAGAAEAIGAIKSAGTASVAKPDAENAFKKLTTLVGAWKGNFADGREHTVRYRLTAGGTVLVETWTLSAVRESTTMYHLDGDTLMATHYCPQGNQPRLLLVSDAERLRFEFRDGTNLQVPNRSHQHSFWLEVNDKDHFQRNENYVDNGAALPVAPAEDPKEAVSYTRVRDE